MNTVDALNVLGKALCGDSFEVKPGLTDAETILEIAKNYSGGGGGSFLPVVKLSYTATYSGEIGNIEFSNVVCSKTVEELRALKTGYMHFLSNPHILLEITETSVYDGGTETNTYDPVLCNIGEWGSSGNIDFYRIYLTHDANQFRTYGLYLELNVEDGEIVGIDSMGETSLGSY